MHTPVVGLCVIRINFTICRIVHARLKIATTQRIHGLEFCAMIAVVLYILSLLSQINTQEKRMRHVNTQYKPQGQDKVRNTSCFFGCLTRSCGMTQLWWWRDSSKCDFVDEQRWILRNDGCRWLHRLLVTQNVRIDAYPGYCASIFVRRWASSHVHIFHGCKFMHAYMFMNMYVHE